MAKKKKNATRRILFILLGLVVLLAVLAGVGKATGLIGERDDRVVVEATTAEVRSITQVVTASGNMQPEIEVRISPDVSGEIINLPVKEGDQVARGTLLARIKPEFYVTLVEQAEAGVLQAKAGQAQRRADMLNAELEMKRQQELFSKQAVSESDNQRAMTQYEVQKAAHEAAQYSVQSADARLREARENLAKTTIYAPMNGTVSKLNVELGERVVGTSQMTGTEMMIIARLDQMEMEVDINENDVVNVAIGDTARLEVDAYPERPFRGVVTEIANSARTTGMGTQEQVTNFPVKVRILDRHNVDSVYGQSGQAITTAEVPVPTADLPRFRPGMSGTVDIFTQTVDDAVSVPIQAVTVRDFVKLKREEEQKAKKDKKEKAAEDEDDAAADSSAAADPANLLKEDLRRVVFVIEDDKARVVEVETGISDDSHIVIRAGLAGGERVITGPYRVVSRTLTTDTAVRERGPKKGAPVPSPPVKSSRGGEAP